MITADVTSNSDALDAMLSAWEELVNTQVLVGIPEDESARKEGAVSNADLLYIHSNGSPLKGIPARPVIEPALEHNKVRLGEIMGRASKAAMDGNIAEMHRELNKAGMAGQSAAKQWFTDPNNNWAPLNEKTKKQKEKKGATVERPLIDTGQLQNSITYVVRGKE